MSQRDYQAWAVAETWRYFSEKNGNPVIAMPTGTGKSHVIAELLQSMLYAFPTTRAMILTHVKELIKQNYSKFIASWPNAPAGIYSAGLKQKNHYNAITFGGIASVAKQAELFGHVDLLFVDECDLVSPAETTMYNKFITALKKKNPHLKVIGLTATPWRAGLGAITNEGGLFTDVCVDMTGVDAFNWFIEQGYLIPLVPRPTELQLDVSGVHMRGGDFIQAELQHAVDKKEITLKALHETCAIAHNRYAWLVFASGVDHAKHIADELNILGISARAIYSGMDEGDRDRFLDQFAKGQIRALVNNNILTTGFDAPFVDLILMLRPSGSSRLWVQMLGRGTRPCFAPGFDLETQQGRLASIAASHKQDCLVLDFANNILRLGPINDPVIPKQKGKGPAGVAPVKLCPQCKTWNHSSVRFCTFCKDPRYEFVFQTKLKVEASTQQLIKAKAVEMPIVETFKVDHITYTIHHKGDTPILKATYYCGLQKFTDFVCLEHPSGNFALKRARDWWRERTSMPIPETVDEALDVADKLQCPTHLEIWINQKYPTIQRYCYDGSKFGREAPSSVIGATPPTVNVTETRDSAVTKMQSDQERQSIPTMNIMPELHDDDIPF